MVLSELSAECSFDRSFVCDETIMSEANKARNHSGDSELYYVILFIV